MSPRRAMGAVAAMALPVLACGLITWGTRDAQAGAFVETDVFMSGASQENFSAGNFFGPAAGAIVHATATGSDVGGVASWAPGPLPVCDFCELVLTGPLAHSRAEANGTTGSLRASAFAATSASSPVSAEAFGTAMLTDTITFTNPSDTKIGFHIDLDHLSTALDPSDASASAVFEFGMVGAGGPLADLRPMYSLAIHGAPIGSDRTFEFLYGPFGGQPDILFSSPFVFPSYERVIDISEWIDVWGDTLDFYAFLRTDTNCDGGVDCFVSANVGNTGYIIIDSPHISAEGYSYLGPSLLVLVVEPGTGLILLAGFAALGIARRRRG